MFISLTLLLTFNLYYQYLFVFNFVSSNGNKCFCFARYFIRKQYILTAINDVMVINKKVSKI